MLHYIAFLVGVGYTTMKYQFLANFGLSQFLMVGNSISEKNLAPKNLCFSNFMRKLLISQVCYNEQNERA